MILSISKNSALSEALNHKEMGSTANSALKNWEYASRGMFKSSLQILAII